ncbi:MAG TPA: hypothetical protein VJS64_13400 [Pyrinomonadaceae bacterium]|nr:hypothetical protein [Pyrinomonadaceae bacterium]
MDKFQSPLNSLDAKNAAELKKLNLEIGILERQHQWVGSLIQLVPVLTTLVALAGLFFTSLQAINAQREERINRVQTQIRSDKEQILEFISNEKTSSVRVAFLLDDLQSLIGQLNGGAPETQVVTEQLMRVVWELPFEQKRDFDFDVSAMRKWNGFRLFWQSYPDSHRLFLTMKYYPRLSKLHAQEPPCIEKFDFEDGTMVLTYKNAGQPCQEALTNAFMHGFLEHLNLIKETNRPEILRRELDEFRKLTNNPVLAERLTATYLPSQ